MIPVHCEIQFYKKKQHNETMKNEANKCRFFLENQSLRQIVIILAESDCWDLILLQKSLTLLLWINFHLEYTFGIYSLL
jgi:hypothetical protein